MNRTHPSPKKPKHERRSARPAPSAPPADAGARPRHGNSYDDVVARNDELAGTPSSHAGAADRRAEEPADAALGAPERLEGEA
jgi:hypothetical protein